MKMDSTHIGTRIAGTIFGVVALEIVSGKINKNYRPKDEFVYLLDRVILYCLAFSFIPCLMLIGKHLIAKHHIVSAYVLQESGSLSEVVDPESGSEYSSEEAMVMLNVALSSTKANSCESCCS
eukprot:XP_024436735.1 probable LRR receptor-like serine/threonine-protein kinase At1g07650 isoform X1 [Populus trichocarpa]